MRAEGASASPPRPPADTGGQKTLFPSARTMNDLGFNDTLPRWLDTRWRRQPSIECGEADDSERRNFMIGKFNIQGAQGVSGLLRFFRDVGRLKKTPRTGWIEAGIARHESV